MDSPGNTQEWLATIIDAGECDFDFNMVPGDANQGNVLADFNAQTKNYWKVTLPGSGGAFSFQAYVTSADASLEPTKAATRSCKLKITGVLAFA